MTRSCDLSAVGVSPAPLTSGRFSTAQNLALFCLLALSAPLLGACATSTSPALSGAVASKSSNSHHTFADSAEAIQEKTYSILWHAKVEGTKQRPYRPVELASPEMDSLAGLVFTATRDGYLTAFGARTHDHARVWEKHLGGPFNGGPTLDGGVLYVASGNGKVWALDATTGEQKWVYETKEAFSTQPVIAEGLVLLMNSDDALVALDAQSGAWKWQYKRDLPSGLTLFGATQPAVREGKVYAGYADGTAVALDLTTGAPVWEKQLSKAQNFKDLDASPVVDEDGNVYFASNADGLFSLDSATGAIRWHYKRTGINALALNASGTKVFAGGSGFIGLFSAQDGKMSWGRELKSGTSVTAIAVTNGQVLASCGAEPMHILEEETGRVRRQFQPGEGVTAKATITDDGEVLILSNRGHLYVMATHP